MIELHGFEQALVAKNLSSLNNHTNVFPNDLIYG